MVTLSKKRFIQCGYLPVPDVIQLLTEHTLHCTGESRGVGGIFFDDLMDGSPEKTFKFASVSRLSSADVSVFQYLMSIDYSNNCVEYWLSAFTFAHVQSIVWGKMCQVEF